MIHPDCAKKVLELGKGESVNKGFLDLFNAIAQENHMKNNPSGTMVVPFYDDNTDPKNGDYVAELHFVVRKVDTSGRTLDRSSG